MCTWLYILTNFFFYLISFITCTNNNNNNNNSNNNNNNNNTITIMILTMIKIRMHLTSWTLFHSFAFQHTCNKYKRVFQALFPFFVPGNSWNVAPTHLKLRHTKYQNFFCINITTQHRKEHLCIPWHYMDLIQLKFISVIKTFFNKTHINLFLWSRPSF